MSFPAGQPGIVPKNPGLCETTNFAGPGSARTLWTQTATGSMIPRWYRIQKIAFWRDSNIIGVWWIMQKGDTLTTPPNFLSKYRRITDGRE
jgi:hypothetical protein